MKKRIVIDFETEAIGPRPAHYPPKPCGVAIKKPGRKSRYFAWGHPTGNNCTREQAALALKEVWDSGAPIGCHNEKFDLEVAEKYFGLPIPGWERRDDSLYALFLKNPHAKSLSLKPASEELLGKPPEERDRVFEWLEEHGIIKSHIKDGKKVWPRDAGAYISKAPGDVVEAYGIGDVDRTGELLDFILPTFDARMMEAYRRELKLMPILLKNEQEGMRVDVEALRADIAIYQKALEKADRWLRTRLHAPNLNLDADADVAAALKANDLITEWTKTPTGRDSVSKKYLTNDKFRDQQVAGALGYRNRLTTVLSMSMLPWLEEADRHGGVISTTWNQVRQSHGDESKSGTRSGRLSCSRFQNISKDFDDKDDGYVHPKFLRVPPLPLVRKYILPDKGQSFGHRDYKQQELRILAHFEDGALCSAYNSDPDLDVHAYVQKLILQILNLELSRRPVKIMNFLQVYGGGVPAIMEKLKCSRAQAEQLRRAHKAALPGVEILNRQIKAMASEGQPIRTWGGRLYYVEEPKFVNGRLMDFYYKLLNYLIQGSAADCTKEALIRYAAVDKEARFLVTVHDEINFSAPEKAMKKEMKILNDVMASVEFDVPMLSDGKVGPNWGSLKKFED